MRVCDISVSDKGKTHKRKTFYEELFNYGFDKLKQKCRKHKYMETGV